MAHNSCSVHTLALFSKVLMGNDPNSNWRTMCLNLRQLKQNILLQHSKMRAVLRILQGIKYPNYYRILRILKDN